MKKLLLILLITIPFIGFGQTKYQKDYYESGKLEKEGNGYWEDLGDGVSRLVNLGLWKYYYESGQLETEGNYQDGKQDGLWKYYYESGQLKKKVNWKDGEVNGPKESYYESGQLEREGNYQDGEQVGLWKSYYESGQLETTRNFKEGDDIRVDGGEHYKYQDFKHYYENGKIKEEGSGMVGGEMDRLLIYRITWDENGNKTIQVDNRDNLEYEKW